MKKILRLTALLIVIMIVLPLTSCDTSEGSVYYNLMTLLGFDMIDYESEVGIRFPGTNDEIYKTVSDMITILVYDSVDIALFETTREASTGNSDAILNYMLRSSYSAYSGNSALLAEAEEIYPQYHITTLIPKADYESYVYRYFGGNTSVQHASTVHFTYLPKLNAYTTTGQPLSSDVVITVDSVVETAHTYRVEFTLSDGEESCCYKSMLMKRDDKTLYVRFVRLAEEADETK